MAKSSRFCVVFDPMYERRTIKRKPPVYVFRGSAPLPDCLLNKCKPSLQMQINTSKGQLIFGKENEINLVEREFGDNVHRVDWKGSSNSGNLADFIKVNLSSYFSTQLASG